MSSYLGLYVENNIIKYAKVSKEKDALKIDSFGMKFYNDVSKTIKQIIEETYSYKVPISINLSNETYQYFNMSSLLNTRDLNKAIDIEFDSYCSEKGFSSANMENRYALVKNIEDKEKIKVINVSVNKTELNKNKDKLEGYRLTNISPISMCIPNIISNEEKENVLIVNMESQTKVTTVIEQNIYDVQILEQGAEEILDKINLKENSYAKAYEICKNTTIYTAISDDFNEEKGRYLDDIMPTLYNIVGKVQKIINTSPAKIKKVYLTGTLSCINNIDLYFQEYLENVKCEVVRPYFVKNVSKEINIKDYIEVNSAISLALQGLGEGTGGMNFKEGNINGLNIPRSITIPITKKKVVEFELDDFRSELTKYEKILIRLSIALALTSVLYSGFSKTIESQVEKVQKDADKAKQQITAQTQLIDSDTEKLNSKTSEYTELIERIDSTNDKKSDINQSKNLIPNLLTQIMSVIPEGVQITAIQNTTGKHITIDAQSNDYSDLGVFKAMLKNKNILTNAVSGSGVQQGDIIKVTIEGDLP